MTATEALQKGLVHEVLPHRTFGEDLILRVKEFTAQIRQVSVLINVIDVSFKGRSCSNFSVFVEFAG